MNKNRRLSPLRLSYRVGEGLGAALLAAVAFILIFRGTILNGYGKGKAERVFAKTYPGCALHIGKLDYSVGADRLVAHAVTLSGPSLTIKADRISLTGARWARILWGTAAPADVLASAIIEAANFDAEFPRAHYGIHCARLQASVPTAEFIAGGTELRTLVGDEEFFAAHAYRTTRFHVILPECRVSGLAYDDLLQGKSYRAGSVYFSQPSFDALVNRDKPVEPNVKRPLMLNEALASIRQPLQIDSLTITNGHVTYRERVVAEADPGVLTFAAVSLSAKSIANRGEPAGAIRLDAQGDFMNAGMLKVLMTIPISPPDFALHYSGSLSAMDLTRLDAFLDVAERTRIKSGTAKEARFEIDVTAGQARGQVWAIYKDLEIAILDKHTDTEKGLGNRVASILANAFKIRSSNAPDASGSMKVGKVRYTRRPEDEFLQVVWFALRSGVLDIISE